MRVARARAVAALLCLASRPRGSRLACSLGLKERTTHVFHGRYEHRLRPAGDDFSIAPKAVVLRNDTIPTMLDFYCVEVPLFRQRFRAQRATGVACRAPDRFPITSCLRSKLP
jgi:hypothetical protein